MNLKIGLLVPRSDMYPTLGMDLLNGLKLSFMNSEELSVTPNFIVEGIGNAVDVTILKTAEKLILQDNVDLTIAFCGYGQLTALINLFNNYKKPLIRLDLGGSILLKEQVNPYVIHHTLNAWQAAHVSGVYAAKTYGKNGAVIASIYDGGYHMSAALVEGFVKNGGAISSYYVSPMDYKTETFEGMLTGLQESSPDVIFALFSFKEGQKVFDVIAKSNLNGKTPIIAIPFMTDASFNTENLQVEEVLSFANWSFDDERPTMQHFVSSYEDEHEEDPNIIGLLGYEVGQLLNSLISSEGKLPKKIADSLQHKTVETPRGHLKYNSFNESQLDTFKIREFQYNESKYHNKIKGTVDATFTEKLYEDFDKFPSPGWQNPYICT